MRQWLRSHLSYGNVTATIALFVALGGTAAAAVIITDNSQVAPDTISGHKPPSGKHANIIAGSINTQDVAIAPGPATLVGLPDALPFCNTVSPPNSWADQSPDVNNSVGYYRDSLGRVYLQGPAKKCGTPASGNTIFTLPLGFRPKRANHFGTVDTDAPGEVVVDNSGHVIAGPVPGPAFSTNHWISLDGISFRCSPSGQNGCR